MALSKSAVNKKYDELRAQLKSGELSQKAFKTAADRLYTMYHSKEAKAQRAKAAAKPKVTKKVASTSKPKPAAKPKPASKVPERFAAGGKGGKFDKSTSRVPERFAAGGKGGKFDKLVQEKRKSQISRLKMSEHPGLAKNKKKAPKAGDTKTVNGQKYYHDGSKWVKGTYKSTRFKR